ncbi:WD repeat-containing protein 44-like isoform X2 [Mangifera indica]|uniref:WD repeat-containing protein 44-like isoform X2 n=1 Tax=Mangifera indica TaxID=29780 RepID=UPI001CFBB3B8|nr:WD repeat-containing protein 44-like isoform X2 [Mangifera indica]
MRGGYIEEEEDLFFDTHEEISSVSDRVSDCCEGCSSSDFELVSSIAGYSQYEFWTKYPESVNERRSKFLELTGLSFDRHLINSEDSGDESCYDIHPDNNRITENSGAVLRTSGFEDEIFFNQSSISSELCSLDNGAAYTLENEFASGTKTSDNRLKFLVSDINQDEILSRLKEMGSSRSFSFEEFQRSSGSGSSSPWVQRMLSRGRDKGKDLVSGKRKAKVGWLKKIGAVACVVDRHETASSSPSDHELTSGTRMCRVQAHPLKKRSKELSSLYTGQEFVAHEGSILTMKFSLDGQYLASAGEDGTVRVWKVIEDDRLDRFDIQDLDPSCLYFTINHLSQITPLDVDKEKVDKTKNLRSSSDSTCVVLPPKVFRILEKPLHEFQGHSSEVLDLSWSRNGFLLSSSVDKTVRLWQVGCDRCLRVFSHNNYVTSVAFNPLDDNYFISGSIDGKVRIWEVLHCQVVDYTDIREIVSAVCYQPHGKGGIVGTMNGNCIFYDIIDNKLLEDTQICLPGKKKLPGKRITGFQFSPSDPSKVIVTSADSLVRVLCGPDVISKFKGYRIAGSQMFATFTSDGKHVVSASEDSNVYIWNYPNQDRTSSKAKSLWSCESFMSRNASIAVPWFGIEAAPGTGPSPSFGGNIQPNNFENDKKHDNLDRESDQKTPQSPSDCFSLARGFLLEYLNKGGIATWPEEKLPNASPRAASPLCKSKLKLLKNACHSLLSSPHLWGLVVVTASWDGRIRTYLNYGLPIRL